MRVAMAGDSLHETIREGSYNYTTDNQGISPLPSPITTTIGVSQGKVYALSPSMVPREDGAYAKLLYAPIHATSAPQLQTHTMTTASLHPASSQIQSVSPQSRIVQSPANFFPLTATSTTSGSSQPYTPSQPHPTRMTKQRKISDSKAKSAKAQLTFSDIESGLPGTQVDTESDGRLAPSRIQSHTGTLTRSQQPENIGKLTKLLNIVVQESTSLKRGSSGESHWTTDDKNVIHIGRIVCGGLGDVHRVFPPLNVFHNM